MSSATGCVLYNKPGWPNNTLFQHWTLAFGDNIRYFSPDAKATFARNFSYKDVLAVSAAFNTNLGAGIVCAPKNEGTSSEACVDEPTFNLHHNVFQGRTAGNYTEFNNGVGTNPPTTIYFPATVSCAGNIPNLTCIGFVGFWNGATYPPADWVNFDYHNLRLCTGVGMPVAACGGASSFATSASDGTAIGVNFTTLDSAQTRTNYVCSTSCGGGPFPD